ncbi:protein of unknown function [Bradyrhizobium sp. ORS 285]|uniref:phage protein Gp36 family protein n=1 Tax=Bradyrhizobium sp. ORS 285 TaxID=115808 RepID=UPI0002409594|nr:phage protein Gp36 family protein [Bradyrhizobium sp. ORS 285]CCD89848.1 hypothetical protein BRAO285_850053 [Bradyrhizobium sp. ORS 285]SMX61524.1 protein of unknown function [Bradyrhizobium sp. ORS 285]
MKTLTAPTEDFIKGEMGVLAADAAAGTNITITLQDNNGFSANDFVAIGNEGTELAEVAQIGSIVGNTQIVVGTLKLAHRAGEPIRVYKYDKRKFYGATSATGAFTELTSYGSPKLIQADDPMGTTLEYTDSTYTYFKATYFNSFTNTETDIADAVAVQGDESGRYAGLYFIRRHAGVAQNPRYSDLLVEAKRTQAENEIDSALAVRYVLPLSYVPKLIERVCILLAAGYIDYEEFGQEGMGVRWLGEARAILKGIEDGKRRLLDANKQELPLNVENTELAGVPNASTDSSEDARTNMDDIF